jgi:hypothetical protein
MNIRKHDIGVVSAAHDMHEIASEHPIIYWLDNEARLVGVDIFLSNRNGRPDRQSLSCVTICDISFSIVRSMIYCVRIIHVGHVCM